VHRFVPLLVILLASPARADDREVRAVFTMALGAASHVDGSERFTTVAGDASSQPLAAHVGLTTAIGDWALELMALSTPIRYGGAARSLIVFDPALRHDVLHAGPLRLFVRGDLVAGRLQSESRDGPCTEDGCTTIEIPGLDAFGFGVGAGVELGHCTRDRGYFAIGAAAASDLVRIDGDATRLTTVTVGVTFGTCIRG
jgi:hypothetical protein